MANPGKPARPDAGPLTVLDARKGAAAPSERGQVTYTVLDGPRGPAPQIDRRAGPRQRVRLRSGKVLDAQGRFITECVLHDVSPAGSRIRHDGARALPDDLYVYDDSSGLLHRAVVLWRNTREAGVHFRSDPPSARTRAIALTMRRKFYALPR